MSKTVDIVVGKDNRIKEGSTSFQLGMEFSSTTFYSLEHGMTESATGTFFSGRELKRDDRQFSWRRWMMETARVRIIFTVNEQKNFLCELWD